MRQEAISSFYLLSPQREGHILQNIYIFILYPSGFIIKIKISTRNIIFLDNLLYRDIYSMNIQHRMNLSQVMVLQEIAPVIKQIQNVEAIDTTQTMILKANMHVKQQHLHITKPTLYQFQSKASGIILIKQDYIKLFYTDQQLTSAINSIQLMFYDKSDSQKEILEIIIAKRAISIFYIKENNNYQHQDFQIQEDLFPQSKLAPLFLQKKIWIEFNRIQKKLSIFTGDIAQDKKPIVEKSFSNLVSANRQGWNNEADVFDLPNYNLTSTQKRSSVKKINEYFTQLKYFSIVFTTSSNKSNLQYDNRIRDYITIQVLKLGRIYKPTIGQNISLLKPNQAINEEMPPQLKYLYHSLQNLNIKKLPDFNSHLLTADERQEYLNWGELQFALYHSLVTPYGYNFDGKPIGILNHLYKLKIKKEYQPLILGKKVQGQKKGQRLLNKQELTNEIYKNRSGYIRLELLPHEGLAPGSMQVLQIWPPYHCSSIHNHGQAYGIIKVLSGSIRVQNYSELSFNELEKPYLQSDYSADQYTWLSELSFGIHRLTNVKPQICVTLQSYYHNEVTNEFFSVVKNINGIKKYIEYYPQNDWINYLNWKPAPNDKSQESKEDLKFIQTIKKQYGLIRENKTVYCFPTMVIALKREYEYLKNYL